MAATAPDPDLCASCGRPLPRARGAAAGPRVYCSKRCRHRRVGPRDRALERIVLELLGGRLPQATLCPSEVARRAEPDGWRQWMEPVRRACRRLAARDEVRFLQRGRVVDGATARGPVRIGRGPAWGERP